MALSDEQIDALAEQHQCFSNLSKVRGGPWVAGHVDFARAIESEVRKQDTELIRQLVDALEKIGAAMPFPVAYHAIAAARARLEGKP